MTREDHDIPLGLFGVLHPLLLLVLSLQLGQLLLLLLLRVLRGLRVIRIFLEGVVTEGSVEQAIVELLREAPLGHPVGYGLEGGGDLVHDYSLSLPVDYERVVAILK